MFLILFMLFVQAQAIFREPSVPKLMIISYTGFRYDYFNHNVTPFMDELREDWGDVRYSKREFSERKNSLNVTITNGYSTGTHEALTTNDLFHGEVVQVNESLQMITHAQDVLPIWIINELSGGNRSSGLMMWPGRDFAVNGTRATYGMEFNENEDDDWYSRIDVVVSWFKELQRPINLAMLYFAGPDFPAHGAHTESPTIDDLLSRLDNATKYLYHQLMENNLTDVNVIHLSDRIMIDIPSLRMINITAIIGNEHYEVVESASTKIINPEEDNAVRIYGKLQASAETTRGFKVYWKDEIPQIRSNQQIGMKAIIVIAKPGYVFDEAVTNYYSILKTTIDINITREFEIDASKENNDDDETGVFFFATGPVFKKNCTLRPINNGDLYPLICHILKIYCHGTTEAIASFEECIKEIEKQSNFDVFFVVLIAMAIFLVIVTTVIIFTMKRRRQQIVVLDLQR